MNILFDLDGTLIDASERMYRLFCDLIPACTLTKEEYWTCKRNKTTHNQLIDMLYPETDYEAFRRQWLLKIEERHYLAMDRLYPDTLAALEVIRRRGRLILLTARQSAENLLWELNALGIDRYFDSVLLTEGKREKEDVLKEWARHQPALAAEDTLFVSDMGKDILSGKRMGYRTVGITHGFMSGEQLGKYGPDEMIKELSELVNREEIFL